MNKSESTFRHYSHTLGLFKKSLAKAKVLAAMAKVPMLLTDAPWNGLLWDSTNRRMIMSGDNRALAERLLAYGLTGDTKLTGKTDIEMRREWAGILQTKTAQVTLPSWSKLKK